MIYNKTPLIRIKSELLERVGVSLLLKREDLNHSYVSGNKWWKLKYNLEQALKEGHTKLLTFGGAYSNHLYATASAANEMGLKSIGIVRGEETLPLNPTLSFAKSRGMELRYVSRDIYQTKNEMEFVQSLADKFGRFYLIPEGGTNDLAIKGCEEWAQLLHDEVDFDYLCLPVGTGGTMAGMINILKNKSIIGFSSLRGGSFLVEEIKSWLKHDLTNWRIETQYHFGGYGKVNKELMNFISEFDLNHNVPLDPVYTGKMLYGIIKMLKQKKFEQESKILVLHTGGLQGRSEFNF